MPRIGFFTDANGRSVPCSNAVISPISQRKYDRAAQCVFLNDYGAIMERILVLNMDKSKSAET